MASGVQPSSYADAAPRHGGDDAALLRLCAAFIASAQARSIEGARLDNMPWSAAVDGGYGELCRSAPAHKSMLAEIMSSVPVTVAGLLAKAHAVRIHRRDPESEPVSYVALADDIISLFERTPERREARSETAPDVFLVASNPRHASPEG
jgi:hypothetical protein